MRVRPARADDAAALASIQAREGPGAWREAAMAERLSLPTSRAWVVEVDAQVVGFLLSSVVVDEAEILLVAIAPAWRRRGLGTVLLDEATASWRVEGVATAYLDVRSDNAAAHALYRAAGWNRAGRRAGYYSDGADALILTKALRPDEGDPRPL